MGSSYPGSAGGENRPQRIQRLVDECLSRQIAGERVSIEDIGSSHADLMPELGDALRKAMLIENARRRAKSGVTGTFAPAGYEIVRQIRRGGQGVVFEAVQQSTGRTVAIKWMREGSFASSGDKMRFEREVRILAQLNHPNIVTIHDSGATPGGDNYFVMKYIPGVPLDEFVEQNSSKAASGMASIKDCLQLFHKICDAVHAAHLRGIIHRDLKPSNIRVDVQGEPHVLDFGLAKLSEQESTLTHAVHGHEFTQSGQFIGSLPWASPEQVEGRTDSLDIRTDVYSLGVILFQMLTGKFPYPVFGNIREVMDHITRASPASPRSLRPELDDEIETIVLKCLAKEPERRYQSAGELGRDIERYIAGDAIEAKRDSMHYVLRKQLRRYRVPLAIAAAFVLLITGGLFASIYLWQKAVAESRRARIATEAESQQRTLADRNAEEARAEAAKSRAALNFVSEMFGAVDPVLARGHDVTVEEVLDPAAKKVAKAFADQPQAEMSVRDVLGHAYGHVGRYKEAVQELQRALELRQTLGQTEDAEALTLQHDLGVAMVQMGDVEHSREILQRVRDKRVALLGPDSKDTLATRSVLAQIRQLSDDVPGAIDDIRAVLTDQERTLGQTDRDTIDSMASLADMLQTSGKLPESLAVAHDAAQRASSAHGADSNVALMTRSIEAEALLSLDRHEDAILLLDQVTKGKEKLYGEGHPSTLLTLNIFASALFRGGQIERSVALRRTIVERANRSLSEHDPSQLTYQNNLAQALRLTGHLDEAEPIFRRLIVSYRETDGPKGRDTLIVMSNLGLLLLQREKAEEALPLFEDVLKAFRETLPADHWMIGVAMMNLGKCQTALGHHAEAETTLLESHAFLEKTLGHPHERTILVRMALAKLYEAWGKPDEAAKWQPPTASQNATTAPTTAKSQQSNSSQ